MPEPPPRQHKHERRYTPSTHSVIQQGDYEIMIMAARLYSGTFVGLKFPDICLTGEEKPRKTSPRKPFPTGGRTLAHCVTGAHATACSTAH